MKTLTNVKMEIFAAKIQIVKILMVHILVIVTTASQDRFISMCN